MPVYKLTKSQSAFMAEFTDAKSRVQVRPGARLTVGRRLEKIGLIHLYADEMMARLSQRGLEFLGFRH